MNAVGIGWLQEESVANIALVEEVTREIHQVISQHGVAVAGVADAGDAAGESDDVSTSAAMRPRMCSAETAPPAR